MYHCTLPKYRKICRCLCHLMLGNYKIRKFHLLSCRGTLGSSILLFCELGIVLGYIIGTYVPLAYSPYVGLLFPIAFVCTFVLFPSTPKYLLRKGKTQAALASLQFYRNARKTGRISEIGEEFEKLNGVVEASRTNSVKISDFCKICNFRQCKCATNLK